MGDQVLVRFAELLKAKIEAPHILGRWGGEEFLILTKNLTLFETEELAESFRRSVEETSFPRGISITVSAGLAMIDANRDIRDALVRADKALYQAKASGRNRAELVAREME